MSYIFYNPNTVSPYAGDCVVRAIAKYFGWDWQRAYLEICLHGAMLWDMPRDNRVWSNFLETRGLIRHHIPYFCTVKEFCDEHPIRCILSIDVGGKEESIIHIIFIKQYTIIAMNNGKTKIILI